MGIFRDVQFNLGTPGYDRPQVDSFLTKLGGKVEELQGLWRGVTERADRLVAEVEELGLTVTAPPKTEPPFTERADPIGAMRFTDVGRGYDRAEVDRFLYAAGVQVAELQHQYRRQAARAAHAQRLLDDAGASPR